MLTSQISNCPMVCQRRVGLGECHWEDAITGWPMSLTWNIGGFSPLSLSLEYELHFSSLLPEAALPVQPWDSDVVWRPYGQRTRPDPVKILQTFKMWWVVQRSTHFRHQRLVRKRPCSWNLPSTNLGWPVSFFALSLPSKYGDNFRLHLGSSRGAWTLTVD